MSNRPGFTLRATKTGDETIFDRERFKQLWRRLRDGEYDLTVEKHVDSRTAKQNAYYHAVVVDMLADYWGVDHDDAHELIKLHCNKKTVNVVDKDTGEVDEVTIGASTANLNKEEWSLFIERCQRWAAMEFHVVLPDPDPEWMFNDAEKSKRRSAA